MTDAAKKKSISLPGLAALRLVLLLVVALCLPETRVWGFQITAPPASGVFESASPSSVGEFTTAWQYDVSDSSLAQRATANANRIMGARAVDDFIVQAERNGFEVVGREVSFRTPFGNRRMDVVLRNLETGKVGGIEIKSTQGAFDRLDRAARQQFAGDRWINTHGADAVGQFEGLSIDHTMKFLWPAP